MNTFLDPELPVEAPVRTKAARPATAKKKPVDKQAIERRRVLVPEEPIADVPGRIGATRPFPVDQGQAPVRHCQQIGTGGITMAQARDVRIGATQ